MPIAAQCGDLFPITNIKNVVICEFYFFTNIDRIQNPDAVDGNIVLFSPVDNAVAHDDGVTNCVLVALYSVVSVAFDGIDIAALYP